MKQLTITFVTLIMGCAIHGQVPERKILVYANGAYSQDKTNTSIGLLQLSTELKGEKISLGISGKVNTFMYAGIGLGYAKSKEYRDYDIDQLKDPGGNYAYFHNPSKSEESKIFPTVNLKFFKNISDHFCLGLHVNAGYEFTKRVDEYLAGIHVSYPDVSPLFLSANHNESSKQGIYLNIQPELVYYVTDWLGFSAEFNFFTYDALHASQFFFATNSNDIMWSFGIVFPIK
jgi:hypothetical protein